MVCCTRYLDSTLPCPPHLTLKLLQVHNLILILLSAGMASSAVYFAVQGGYTLWGNAFKLSERGMALTIYVFYLSKFYEFFDTVGLPAVLLHQPVFLAMCSPCILHNISKSSILLQTIHRMNPAASLFMHKYLECRAEFS